MTHLIKTVMSYPPGHVPSGWDAPEGYVPESSIEDYDLAFAEATPIVGQQFEAYGQQWAIARVQTYQPLNQYETALESFHLAIASLDGSVPAREPWHDGNGPLLVIHATAKGLIANEYGEPRWELVEREDWIAPVEGMVIEAVQHFEAAGIPIPGDYNRVVVAWSVDAIAMPKYSTQEAA
ncbi:MULTISPECIES: hypothetical protein [Cyanophyceae]|uniref:Uncharacterized protein n=1 Tax=Leptolyngbya subtilissima DQ-A4 TaxID=2933933 RepID=A0ABV0KA03_9CYAN|nr:hypothetical protein [Nodosilinea sp. FACHB-141]MBD2110888.1 hypothetical protein [Nodosilinea sp. FACHB-141]